MSALPLHPASLRMPPRGRTPDFGRALQCWLLYCYLVGFLLGTGIH